MSSAPPDVIAEVEQFVSALQRLCSGRNAHVLIASLEEMYARVVSDCIHNPDEMEKALHQFAEHVRGWWIADRGGPFRPT